MYFLLSQMQNFTRYFWKCQTASEKGGASSYKVEFGKNGKEKTTSR